MIYKSKTCECINVTLPNVNIHLDAEGFRQFSGLIEANYEFLSHPDTTKTVCCVDTPYKGITLHFNLDQIKDLRETILDAHLQMELQSLHQ